MEVALLAKIRNGALVRYRQKHGYSQAMAAEMLDVSPGVWNAIECMRFKDVAWDTIRHLAERLEIPVEHVCPPELRKKVLRLDRVYFQEVRTEAMLATDQVRRLILPDPAEEAQRKLDHELLKERVRAGLSTLTYREREILKLRFGLDDGYTYTLEEIGKMFKVCRDRIRQIEAKAIRKLQHPARANRLKALAE